MADENKKVFISYRREPTKFLALLLFKELRNRGYDVFWDIEGIGAGKFERVILGEILARPFFLVLLAHGTLDRVYEPNDWLRREIEYAIEHDRIIVPLLVEDFEFSDAEKYLKTGKLAQLSEYQAAHIRVELFDSYLDNLCNKFLIRDSVHPELTLLSKDIADKAAEIIEDAIEAPEPTEEQLSAEELFRRAYNKADAGDYDGAIADYTASIAIQTDFVAYNNRGNAYKARGDYKQAFRDYDKALELNPDYVLTYNNRGNAYIIQGNYEQAIQDYNKALELDPNYSVAYSNRAGAFYHMLNFEQVLRDCNNSIRLDRGNADAYNNRGNVYSAKGNYKQAIRDYNKALKLDSNNIGAYFQRGTTYYVLGSLAKSLADFEKMLELESNNAMGHNNRGVVLLTMKRYEEALESLNKANELDPNREYTIADLSITYHVLGNIEEAQKLWLGLLKIDEQYRDAEWVGKELNWHESLIEEARKLIAGLNLD